MSIKKDRFSSAPLVDIGTIAIAIRVRWFLDHYSNYILYVYKPKNYNFNHTELQLLALSVRHRVSSRTRSV